MIEYVNPVDGGSTFPTMNTCIRIVPGNTTIEAHHRTENIIFITMEGSATFQLPDKTFDTEPFDVTAIPSWVPYSDHQHEQRPSGAVLVLGPAGVPEARLLPRSWRVIAGSRHGPASTRA